MFLFFECLVEMGLATKRWLLPTGAKQKWLASLRLVITFGKQVRRGISFMTTLWKVSS
jgi:hypothetical protein